MKIKKYISLLILLSCVAGVLLIIEFLRLPHDTHLWRAIHNAGHAPLSGILALALLGISRIALGTRIRNPITNYVIAFTLTVSIGAVSEILQIPQERDADIWDLVRDVAGTISFLTLYMAIDPAVKQTRIRIGWLRAALIVIAVLFFVSTLVPSALWVVADRHRESIIPDILTFESVWEEKYITVIDAELVIVKPPDGFIGAGAGFVGKLIMLSATYPGMRIDEPFPDWSEYSYFRFEAYSELDTTVQIAVRIDDLWHDGGYPDRFNSVVRIHPGLNRISIPLEKVRNAPVSREMDMTKIWAIHLFAFDIQDTIEVYLDNFRVQ